MRTFRDAKTMAKALRTELSERRQIDLSHSECLEIVARQFGFDNWNVMAAKVAGHPYPTAIEQPEKVATTIPLLRIFSVERALQFYVELMGFNLDFGGPADGNEAPFYGQVTHNGTTFNLTEVPYEDTPGATVLIWMMGIEKLFQELHEKKDHVRVWGPGVWLPAIEEVPWGARSLTIPDPFGNVLRFLRADERPPGAPARAPGLAVSRRS